ncbi:Ig-like domain-containing protein, partial [Aeromonas veronii]
MMSILRYCGFLLATLLATLLAGCGGDGGGDGGGEPANPGRGQSVIVSLQVSPADAQVSVGFGRAFVATAVYADNSTRDVTESVEWTSGDKAVATVDAVGRVTGVSPGSVDIAAHYEQGGNKVVGEAMLTVTAASVVALQVTSATADVPVGLTHAYTATVTLSDGSTL